MSSKANSFSEKAVRNWWKEVEKIAASAPRPKPAKGRIVIKQSDFSLTVASKKKQ